MPIVKKMNGARLAVEFPYEGVDRDRGRARFVPRSISIGWSGADTTQQSPGQATAS
jgi:hypothetical protein